MTPCGVGKRAPEFILADQHGNTVQLSECLGKKSVVLIFYPGDLTSGCTMQLSALRDDWTKFKRADTVILGINHGDAKSHALFAKRCGLPFPLLVDQGKKVSAAYGALQKIGATKVIRRTVVAIDKTGKIVFYKSGMPKNADILKAIK